MENFKHKGPRVLLAEGKNDCHLIVSLCNHYHIPEDFGLHECGSDELVIRKLSALIAGSEEVETIGVVVDADNPGIDGKWSALRARLQSAGYDVPVRPNKGGTIIQADGKPLVGIWLMPDNDVDGMLEDFCKKLASPEAIAFAEECAGRARDSGFSNYIENHTSKAALHTYLAWQNEPGMPMGKAVTAKALDPKYPLAKNFCDFLLNLFSDQHKALEAQ